MMAPEGFTLTGDDSVVLLHDYIESTAERGRAVPGAVETSRSTWAEALGINWPLENPLVCRITGRLKRDPETCTPNETRYG